MAYKIILTAEQLTMAQKMASGYIEDLQNDINTFRFNSRAEKLKGPINRLSRQLDTARSVLSQINRKERET